MHVKWKYNEFTGEKKFGLIGLGTIQNVIPIIGYYSCNFQAFLKPIVIIGFSQILGDYIVVFFWSPAGYKKYEHVKS